MAFETSYPEFIQPQQTPLLVVLLIQVIGLSRQVRDVMLQNVAVANDFSLELRSPSWFCTTTIVKCLTKTNRMRHDQRPFYDDADYEHWWLSKAARTW